MAHGRAHPCPLPWPAPSCSPRPPVVLWGAWPHSDPGSPGSFSELPLDSVLVSATTCFDSPVDMSDDTLCGFRCDLP